jgi:ketosteroid isomerase-like protein
MNRIGRLTIVVIFLGSVTVFAEQHSAYEKDVWSLENSYWQYVKANDFEHYLTLWDANFVGWPLSSPEPAGKGQITEWITAHTNKGETLQAYDVERLKAYFGDRYATVTYRVHMTWTNKKGTDVPGSLRVIHTWLRNADGRWQIISGMAAPVNAEGH